jgi:hypothetical protein
MDKIDKSNSAVNGQDHAGYAVVFKKPPQPIPELQLKRL